MKVAMYSIYDSKTGMFHAPTCAINADHAKRHYCKLFAQPESQYMDYHEDYVLMCIGTFDDARGELKGVNGPDHICSGSDLAKMARTLVGRRNGDEIEQ